MSGKKLKKIVFVCTGNTCRSPMAECLLKQALKEKKLRGFKVCSVGVNTRKGKPMNPNSVQVLEERGVTIGKFLSSPVTEKLLQEALAFVCMTEEHKEYLMDMRWNVLRKAGAEEIENNIYSFRDVAGYDVPDPYGCGIERYRETYDLLEGGMSALIENLQLGKHALPAKRGRTKKMPD